MLGIDYDALDKDQVKALNVIMKKKKLKVYKAVIPKDFEELDLNMDVELLSFSKEDAIAHMIHTMDLQEVNNLKYPLNITFIVVTLQTEEFEDKKICDLEQLYLHNNTISITLRDKNIKIDVEDNIIEELEFEFDAKTEIKTLKKVLLK